jgi:UDP-glucose 4-epimerase
VKKALITGGLGFIGLQLARRLLAEDFAVDALDSNSACCRDVEVEATQAYPRFRAIIGDLRDEHCFADLAPDYNLICHMAAVLGVRTVAADPYRVLEDNVVMTSKLIAFARRQRALDRLIFASTSEVYAGTLQYFGLPIPTPESTPLTVTDLAQPRTSYMLSKIYGEALCRHAGLPFTIVRPHNVYGPRMGMVHVVPELLKRAHDCPQGGRLLVYSADHRRTFCFIEDAVELIVRVALSQDGLNGTFNIGSTDAEVSIAALGELIVQTVGKRLSVEAGPVTPGSPVRRRPDVSRTMAVASYQPAVSLAEGLRRTYGWYCSRIFDAAPVAAGHKSTGISIGE